MTAQTLIDFTTNPSTKNWFIVDDVVMGGRSSGNFELTKEGYGKFYGEVSLENNGGFSSVRCDMETVKVTPETTVQIRLKGDGNTYQFRVKAKKSAHYSHINKFKTSGQWETISFKLKDLYPTFRGRVLDLPNFNKNTLEELRFLIGNKKAQPFTLLLKSITLLKEQQ